MFSKIKNSIFNISKVNKIVIHVLLWIVFYLFLLFWYWGYDQFVYVEVFHLDQYKMDFWDKNNILFCFVLCLATVFNYYQLVYLAIPKIKNKSSRIIGAAVAILILMVGYILCYLGLYGFFEHFNQSKLFEVFKRNQFDSNIFHLKNFIFYLNITVYFIGFAITIKLGKDYYLSEKETRKLNQLRNQAEVDYLKNQIRPHFLFNALNSIYGLSLHNEEANSKILRLSEVLRYYVYSPKNIIAFNEFSAILKKIIPNEDICDKIESVYIPVEKAATFPILSHIIKHTEQHSSVTLYTASNHIHISSGETNSWSIPIVKANDK